MSRNDIMKKTAELYLGLTESKKDSFSKIVNRLLAVNYICGSRAKDKNDYFFIDSNIELFECIFSILDYQFYINRADYVAYIINEKNYNHLKLDKLESIVLLLLRKMYFQKSMELQDNDEINISVGELHAEIEATGIYEKRINQTELKKIYSFLSKYNVCERFGDLKSDETRLIIFPTINYIIPVSKIDEINTILKTYNKGEDDYENIDESEID